MKVDKKKIVNLYFKVDINFFLIFSNPFFSFSCLSDEIISCDKAKFFIKESITLEINVEYKIWGIWYKKLNLPLSSYILCNVSSVKKSVLITNSKQKEKKKRNILIILEL